MAKIKFKTPDFRLMMRERLSYVNLCIKSLFFNAHLSQSYFADILLEPIFKFVDTKVFSRFLGPFFVITVCCLTTAVVFICYYIGLPYWMRKSEAMTVFLMIVGNWLLLNVVFHYYMAATTNPGDVQLSEAYNAVSICKKCLVPKPPRSHHCGICGVCVLKFDHHCAFLNKCVGHNNHRYFFLYMTYTVLGVIFIAVFGIGIGYDVLWVGDGGGWEEQEQDKLEGALVRYNLTGHLIPVTEVHYEELGITPKAHQNLPVGTLDDKTTYQLISFMAVIVVGEYTCCFLYHVRANELYFSFCSCNYCSWVAERLALSPN
jgi:palmitoyltransferase